MRRVIPAAGLVAMFLVTSWLPYGTSVSAADGTVTGFFYDGWREQTFPWGLGAISGPGTVTGFMDRPTHLYVEAIGSDGDHWELSLADDDGPPLGPGTYSADEAFLFVSHLGETGCSVIPTNGSITIIDLEVDGAGNVTTLTADFEYMCLHNPPAVLAGGQVRINSSQPLTAMDIEPEHGGFPFTDHDFGIVPVGSTSEWQVTVTNRGTTPLEVEGSLSGDPAFSIEPGGCGGTLAPGASCDLALIFAPSTGGQAFGELHVLSPGFGTSDRPFTLKATGFQATTTSLVVDPLYDALPGGAAYRIEVTPTGVSGTYEITRTCGGGVIAGVAGTFYLETAAGPCTATATFHGYAGFGTSSSDPVSFTMPAKSQVIVYGEYPVMVETDPFTITATVSGANGPEPTAGTLTIVDDTTDEQLATGQIDHSTKSLSIEVDDLAVGDHVIRADYSGDGVVLGSTGTWPLTVTDDAYPPDGSLSVPSYTFASTITVGTQAVDLPIDVVTHVALSNDGVHWATLPYAPTVEWSLTNAAAGGSNVDGNHVVYAKWRDRPGNWSPVASKATILDRGIPTGSATINGGAAFAGSTSVTLSSPAADALSGVSLMAISNDGSTWTTRSYAPLVAWSLPAADGVRTVSVRWRDKAGNWSTTKTDTIALDTHGPTLGAPSVGLQTGSASNGRAPVRVAWAGSDAVSGVAHYQLQMRTDSGAWVSMTSSLSAPSWTRDLLPGHRYAFRARGVDRASNTGPWASSQALDLMAIADGQASVSYAGSWRSVASSSLAGGSAHSTTSSGASATFKFTGRSVGWLASVGPSSGRVAIYVDGTKVATVDLFRSTAAARQVVFTRSWSTSGAHTVRLVNLATPGRPTASVDGFYVFAGRVIGAVSTVR